MNFLIKTLKHNLHLSKYLLKLTILINFEK